jgi:hypothetical protein
MAGEAAAPNGISTALFKFSAAISQPHGDKGQERRDATFAFQQAHKEVRIHVLPKEEGAREGDTVDKSLFLVGCNHSSKRDNSRFNAWRKS